MTVTSAMRVRSWRLRSRTVAVGAAHRLSRSTTAASCSALSGRGVLVGLGGGEGGFGFGQFLKAGFYSWLRSCARAGFRVRRPAALVRPGCVMADRSTASSAARVWRGSTVGELYQPMVQMSQDILAAAGVTEPIGVLTADAGLFRDRLLRVH